MSRLDAQHQRSQSVFCDRPVSYQTAAKPERSESRSKSRHAWALIVADSQKFVGNFRKAVNLSNKVQGHPSTPLLSAPAPEAPPPQGQFRSSYGKLVVAPFRGIKPLNANASLVRWLVG